MANMTRDLDESDQTALSSSSDEMNFWNRIVAVYMGVVPDLERKLQKAGKLSFFEFQVLDHLSTSDGVMSMTQLATRCNSSLSRLSHVARKLEGRELLTRRLSDDDKRVTVAEITDVGRQLIDTLRGVYDEAIESRVIQSLSPEELRQAAELLDKILRRSTPDHWLFSAESRSNHQQEKVVDV